MNKKITIVGAGKEGKGNLGDQFFESGNWDITFLDKDPEVIKALSESQKYEIEAYYSDHIEKRTIIDYEAYLLNQENPCEDVLVHTDLLMLALYPEDIPEAASFLSNALKKRIKINADKLSIVSCTNKNHYMDTVYDSFTKQLNGDEKAWFNQNVALRDMIVRRSANAPSTKDTFLTTKVIETCLVQQPLYVDISDLRWIQLVDDLEELKDIKLFTRNAPHATYAFSGAHKGYKTIEEAMNDKKITALGAAVLEEAKAGILKNYSNAQGKIDIFLKDLDTAVEEEPELITRVGHDPLRKLAKKDRLTGNALMCLKNNVECPNIIKAIAYGMAYKDPKDGSANKLQQLITDKGILEATSEVIGLSTDHFITTNVVNEYDKLKLTK